MEQVVKDLVQGLKERISSPILFAYIVSFIIWNFKSIVVFAYSTKCITCKLELIDNEYAMCKLGAFGLPAISALAYVLIMPRIGLFVDRKTIKQQKERKKLALQLANIDLEKAEIEKTIDENKIRQEEIRKQRLEEDLLIYQRVNDVLSKELFDTFMDDLYNKKETSIDTWSNILKFYDAASSYRTSEINEHYQVFRKQFLDFLRKLEKYAIKTTRGNVITDVGALLGESENDDVFKERVVHFSDDAKSLLGGNRHNNVHVENFAEYYHEARTMLGGR